MNDWLKDQNVVQVNRPVRKRKLFNTVWANYPGEDYQMDTMHYSAHAYHGYQYILLVIDVHSRYLGCCAMKTRNKEVVIECYEKLIRERFGGKNPQLVHCDNEYRYMSEWAHTNGVPTRFKFSQPHQSNKNAVVERVIRTLRMWLGRWRYEEDETNWVDSLDKIVDNYNRTWHRTIKQKPIDIWEGREKNRQKVNFVPVRHKVGDRVRLVLKGKLSDPFKKSGEPLVTQQVYILHEKHGYSWAVMNEATGKIPRYPNRGEKPGEESNEEGEGEPKLFLDYEVIKVEKTEGAQRGVTGTNVSENTANNNTIRALKREGIYNEEDLERFSMEVNELGVFRRGGYILEPPEPVIEQPGGWQRDLGNGVTVTTTDPNAVAEDPADWEPTTIAGPINPQPRGFVEPTAPPKKPTAPEEPFSRGGLRASIRGRRKPPDPNHPLSEENLRQVWRGDTTNAVPYVERRKLSNKWVSEKLSQNRIAALIAEEIRKAQEHQRELNEPEKRRE